MTAIAARIGTDNPSINAAGLARVLAAMRAPDGEPTVAWSDVDIALGCVRSGWESEMAASGADGVVRRGPLSIAADASLYYRAELQRRLTGKAIASPDDSAAALILSAYEACGDSCLAWLEGDFAFVLWDGRRRRMLAARDFGGKRTLYYSVRGEALVIASTIGGVLADDGVPKDLNYGSIAATAASLWGNTDDTCFLAISELRAGHALTWERGRGSTCVPFWNPPLEPVRDSRPLGERGEQLLELLTQATEERMAGRGPTGVTLSGGWDSPAVFAAAQRVLHRDQSTARTMYPVSIRYPPGDPGHEDDLIEETTAFWHTSTEWIDVDGIPMFDRAEMAARHRHEPFAHPYERWNRALFRASRRAGARVVLDGFGGDQLFQVSDVVLSDLFRDLRWIELARQWSSRRRRGVRAFFRSAIRPALSARALRVLALIRRAEPSRHHLVRTPFPWFRPAFLREHAVLEREQSAEPALPWSSAGLAESHFFLLCPFFPRMAGRLAAFARDEGVELRSPLLDARVVNFAVARPWHEKRNGPETKILLRQAMRGLLPERLLAPRTARTGTTSGYFKRSLQGPGRPIVEAMLEDSRLASIGMIEPSVLRRGWEHYLSSSEEELGVRIYNTIQAEMWLREHEGAGS